MLHCSTTPPPLPRSALYLFFRAVVAAACLLAHRRGGSRAARHSNAQTRRSAADRWRRARCASSLFVLLRALALLRYSARRCGALLTLPPAPYHTPAYTRHSYHASITVRYRHSAAHARIFVCCTTFAVFIFLAFSVLLARWFALADLYLRVSQTSARLVYHAVIMRQDGVLRWRSRGRRGAVQSIS